MKPLALIRSRSASDIFQPSARPPRERRVRIRWLFIAISVLLVLACLALPSFVHGSDTRAFNADSRSDDVITSPTQTVTILNPAPGGKPTVYTGVIGGSAAISLEDGKPRVLGIALTRAANEPEPVLIELTGASLASSAAPSGRLQTSAAATLNAQHARVRSEIAGIVAGTQRRAGADPIRREYSLVFNGFAASLTAAEQDRVRALRDVASVSKDPEIRATLDVSVPLVGAPDVWSGFSYRGAGVVIAIADTGVDYNHPDLGGCFGPACKVAGGYDFVNDDADPIDDQGHGTHVAAIAAGNGTLLGVAPDARILAYKVIGSNGTGHGSDIIAALERAVDPDANSDTSDHVAVVNASFSGSGDPDDAMSQAVDAATNVGTLVVAAAGNDGGFFTVGSPASARTALAVGATTKTDEVATSSSGGPAPLTAAIKPEISAPGVDICSARAAGTSFGPTCRDQSHVMLSGTSMAAPHVAGAVALLRGLYPELSPPQIESLLVDNSVDLGASVMRQGAGRLQVAAAAVALTAIEPATLSFGRDDPAVSTWESTNTLKITNLDAASRAYALTTTALPAGVTAQVTPSSFNLGARASKTVTFKLSVINALLPPPAASPFTYEGMLRITSGTQMQHVPFAFLLQSTLTITFDKNPYSVLIHNRRPPDAPDRYAYHVAYPGTQLNLSPPAGIYDVLAIMYPGSGADFDVVIREGVVVAGTTNLDIRMADAVHTLDFRIAEAGSSTLRSAQNFGLWITHRASGYGVYTFGPNPSILLTSSTSDAYDLDFVGERLDSSFRETVVTTAVSDGVTGNRFVGNSVADLNEAEARWYPRPPRDTGLTMEHGIHGPAISTVTRTWLPEYRFTHPLWVSTIPRPDYSLGFYCNFVESNPHIWIDTYPLVRGDVVLGRIHAYASTSGSVPVYTTTTGEMPLNLGPLSWFQELTLLDGGTRLRFDTPVPSRAALPLRAQGGDGPTTPQPVPWEISAGAALVAHGTLSQAYTVPGTAPEDVMLPAAGAYTFRAEGPTHLVGGIASSTWVESAFDSSRPDPSPPWLINLNIRSQGRLTDAVEIGSSVTLAIHAGDDDDLADVEVAYERDGAPVSVPVVATGPDTFEATLTDPCDAPGGVSFSLTLRDSAGNYLRQDFAPGFVCMPASCGNGSVDEDEACDDGDRITGDDGCNSTCTSDESCGNGVRDYAEGCDDGNTVDDDGCSARCRDETRCGNGLIDTGEACDDGNRVAGDGCNATCTSDESCGNGFLDPDEVCEPAEECCSSECVYEDDGTPCSDSDPCTTESTCQDAECTATATTICPPGERCDPDSGECHVQPRSYLCIAAADADAAAFGGAMTTGTAYTAGDPVADADPDRDNLTTPLVFADSDEDVLNGASGDVVTYSVNLGAGHWYLWARLYYPSAPDSNGANSFRLIVDGAVRGIVGNSSQYMRRWHYDGNTPAGTGPVAPIDLGVLTAGVHAIGIQKREVVPIPPRLDVLCLTHDPTAVPPTDTEVCAVLPAGACAAPTTTTLPVTTTSSPTTTATIPVTTTCATTTTTLLPTTTIPATTTSLPATTTTVTQPTTTTSSPVTTSTVPVTTTVHATTTTLSPTTSVPVTTTTLFPTTTTVPATTTSLPATTTTVTQSTTTTLRTTTTLAPTTTTAPTSSTTAPPTTSTTIPGVVCGDPVALTAASAGVNAAFERLITASDALFVLKAAVDLGACDLCICDTSGDGKITARDALATLRAAVGLPGELVCPPCSH